MTPKDPAHLSRDKAIFSSLPASRSDVVVEVFVFPGLTPKSVTVLSLIFRLQPRLDCRERLWLPFWTRFDPVTFATLNPIPARASPALRRKPPV